MKMSIGVDLHKTQFTVCCLNEDRGVQESGIYPTSDHGYRTFIRRILKSRSVLVKAWVSLKNQVHGLLLGYGIESRREQLQSKKERQRILTGLADHRSYGNAAQAVKPLLGTIDQIASEVKELEQVLSDLISEDEDVALLQTIPGVGLITVATILNFLRVHQYPGIFSV
ncbi:MAG: hypothetical protein U9N38_01050 [Thermodesulfobacteriota bacterium]|nr:hypothetical protein [Thermodesulfobacteriota bacterium]